MSLSDFLVGAGFLSVTLAGTLGAAYFILQRRFHHLEGVVQLVAFALLATTTTLFAHLIPAVLGLLDRPTALVGSLALLAAALVVPRSKDTDPTPRPEPPASGVASALIAVIALAVVVVYELARLRIYATQPLTFVDSVGFHLPGIASWIKSGSVWQVDQFLPGFATAQYPNNGDFLILASVLPWHDLAFARFSMVPFFALTGASGYALSLELGASRAAATNFAAAAMTVPYISNFAYAALPDPVTLATLPAGLLFLVRYERTRLTADLAIGALGLGLAFGAKWYGVTAVAVVVGVWMLAWLLGRRPLLATLRDSGLLLAMIGLGGGFWLLRNLIESGNPIYPKTVSLLGAQLFVGSRRDVIDQYGYTIAHYLGQTSILTKYIYPGFKGATGLSGAVILLGSVIAAVAFTRTLRRSATAKASAARGLLLVGVALGICILYAITPGSAYGPENLPLGAYPTLRWLMPALVIGAAVSARAVKHLGRLGLGLELAAVAGMLDGIRRGDAVGLGVVARVLLVLAALAILAALIRGSGPRRRLLSLHAQRGAAAATGLLLVLALGAALRLTQNGFDRHSYASYDPVFAWINTHAPSGHRVGVSGLASNNGIAPVLPLTGPRLGNSTGYVGDRVRHSIAIATTSSSFEADLRRGRYDLLVVGRADTRHTDGWVRSVGWRLVVQSSRLALYAAPPRPKSSPAQG